MDKKWMHITVGFVLITLLVGGITFIIRTVGSDLQIPELNNELAQRGLEVAQANGCVACHSLDGGVGIGPTWLGMYGKTEALDDGTTIVVDEEYILESINRPAAKQVEGFQNVMVRYYLPEEELQALVEFTRQLADQ